MFRIVFAALLFTTGCAAQKAWVPPATTTEPEVTLVWVGRGECERFVDGAWVRAPQFDYDFSVEQRRLGDHWESVKSLRRRHPDYDGSAGERLQTWFFHLEFEATGSTVPLRIASSLGKGTGSTDGQFRKASLELAAEVSSLAPFDRYRIVQDYRYEEGRLDEVVSLDKGNTPWVRNVEHATLFAKHTFAEPPTKR
ncbi:MAG: hypothetical protein ABTQ32_07080 [Myxococcaceae bacterium]